MKLNLIKFANEFFMIGATNTLKLKKNCWNALPKNRKVIVFETILPMEAEQTVAGQCTFNVDLIMLAHFFAGKERTKEEFNLLKKEGREGITERKR
ncbi:hypothetical protein IEQ34_014331 [Dendrobium chrysotoxum]|uniref:O-methyltransferase C-terminal domain-containing protein n=1 Tax=Dendrobium chrysotoxum TaxID=161865 RepID=A0AAV7GLP4_DENCH|nr:hypothetical protein IEQ34_014331 [Dendrobium chrysotoxum]